MFLALTAPITVAANPYVVRATAEPTAEGNSGTRAVAVQFTVSPPVVAGETVRVNYTARNGTASGSIGSARSGLDYVPATGSVTFTFGGPTTQSINVGVIGDTARESSEVFQLNLTVASPVGAVTLDPPQVPVLILNDDRLPDGWAFAVRGTGTVEFDPSSAEDTFTERPGAYPACLGGAFVDRTRFLGVFNRTGVATLEVVDATTLLPSTVGAVTGLLAGETVRGLGIDRPRGRTLLITSQGSTQRLRPVDEATGAAGPAVEVSVPGPWDAQAFHPITGSLHVVAGGILWRVDPVSGAAVAVGEEALGFVPSVPGGAAFVPASGRLYVMGPIPGTAASGLVLINHLSGEVVAADPVREAAGLAGPVALPLTGIGPIDFMASPALPVTYVSLFGGADVAEVRGATTPAGLRVLADPPVPQAVEITVGALDGSARAGRNFLTPVPATFSIPANEAEVALPLTILHDRFPSGTLDFTATLASAVAGVPIDGARVRIRDTDQATVFLLEPNAPGAGGTNPAQVRFIDPPSEETFRLRIEALPFGAARDWSLPLVEFVSDTVVPCADVALELPALDLQDAGWVRIDWRQALEFDAPQPAILPLLEYRVGADGSWLPLVAERVEGTGSRGTLQSPMVVAVDASNQVAGRGDVRFRVRVRDARIARLLIDDFTIRRDDLSEGLSIVRLPAQSLLEGDAATSQTVRAIASPALAAATEFGVTVTGGTAQEGVHFTPPPSSVSASAGAIEVAVPVGILGDDSFGIDRTLALGIAPASANVEVLTTPGTLEIRDDDAPTGRVVRLQGEAGWTGTFGSDIAGVVRERVSPNPFVWLGDWDLRNGDPARAFAVENGSFPRLHEFDTATGRLIGSTPLRLSVPGDEVVGFAWDRSRSAWQCLVRRAGGGYALARVAADGSAELGRRTLTLPGGNGRVARGLAMLQDGTAYTTVSAGAQSDLCRIAPGGTAAAVVVELPFAVGNAASMHHTLGSNEVHVGTGFFEDDFGALPSEWGVFDLTTESFAPLGLIGNSLVRFSGLLIEEPAALPPPRGEWTIY